MFDDLLYSFLRIHIQILLENQKPTVIAAAIREQCTAVNLVFGFKNQDLHGLISTRTMLVAHVRRIRTYIFFRERTLWGQDIKPKRVRAAASSLISSHFSQLDTPTPGVHIIWARGWVDNTKYGCPRTSFWGGGVI